LSVPSAAPTRIGFRRDIRFFFAVLIGFLIVIILGLDLLLLSVAGRLSEDLVREHARGADTAARDLRDLPAPATPLQVTEALASLRSRHGAVAAEIRLRDGQLLRSGFHSPDATEQVRSTPHGDLRLWYDDAEVTALRRTTRLTAVIALGAAILGTILLMLYLPRITRPIEELLDHARTVREPTTERDETSYLIETFRETIARLHAQEEELKHLHAAEKSRADELERITATLTRSLTSGFISLDAGGRIVDLNAAGREILAVAGDPAGKELDAALGRSAFTSTLASALRDRSALTRHELSESRDGRSVSIGLTTVPLTGEEGAFLGMLALFTDLTPIRSLESRIRDLQTLADLGEMSAGIAHEFRNSLSAIRGYLQLARKLGAPEAVERKLESAQEESSQLLAAVEGLLTFARPMTPSFQQVDLREVADATVARLARQYEDVAIEVEGDSARSITGDPALLARALENVLRNAIDSVRARNAAGGRAAGPIRVRVEGGAIAVSDRGLGIDPDDVARLFLPFQSDKATGFGLGLPLARKIVLLHEGTITMEGAPGEGATVTMEFARG
jgi:signal transduction histidine kinase